MVAKTCDDNRGADADGRGTDDSTARSNRSGVAGCGVKGLVDGPAGKSFDDGTGPSKVELVVGEWQFEPAGEGFIATDGLPEGSGRFPTEMDSDGIAVVFEWHVGGLECGEDELSHVCVPPDGCTDVLQFGGYGVAVECMLGEA